MNKNNNDRLPYGCLMYIFAGGVMGIILVVNMIVSSVRDALHLGPFKDHVSEYSTVSGLKNPAMTNPYVTEPYLKGKIITIDKKENRIDDIYYELPEELRATKPEDVGTIVWLEWGEGVVGKYTDGEDATVITCQVTIIDKSIPTIVDERNFEGSEPPALKKRGDSSSGSVPTKEIVAYLRNLPKKTANLTSSSSTPEPKPIPKPKLVQRPTDDNPVPFPTKSGYVKSYPALSVGGYSSVTVDNSKNNSDVFVKLFWLDTTPPKAARVFFIRAHDTFYR